VRTVHKYVLTDVVNQISTYEGARIVHVANQREQITVWAEVNTLERECMATLHVVGTGHEVPPGFDHQGTAVMAGGDYVFHVYAEGETR
jgi:hypothetical protein